MSEENNVIGSDFRSMVMNALTVFKTTMSYAGVSRAEAATCAYGSFQKEDESNEDSSGCDKRLRGLSLEESISKSKKIILEDTISFFGDSLKNIFTANDVIKRGEYELEEEEEEEKKDDEMSISIEMTPAKLSGTQSHDEMVEIA